MSDNRRERRKLESLLTLPLLAGKNLSEEELYRLRNMRRTIIVRTIYY